MVDEEAVRERAQALCAALLAGNIDLAIEVFSPELHRNLGEVLGLLPLPLSAAEVESVVHGNSGFNIVLLLTGESEAVQLLTRWKDRDDQVMVVEVSHLSRAVTEPPVGDGEAPVDGETSSSH